MPQKNYEVVARLADRGIAEVFVARAAEEGGTTPVLIERLARTRVTDPDIVRSFLERARIGFQLAHPNIAQVVDVGRLGSTYYLALEHLDGEPLRAVLDHARAREKLQIPVRTVLTIAAGVASGLRHAHGRQDGDGRALVHGNLSPSNIHIQRDGVVKLLDFGMPPDGQPPYQSPEQVRGDAIDPRSDLFSLGALLWELLTREALFKRGSSVDTLAAIENDPAPPPSVKRMDVPHELDTIVQKLLEKEPADRYADADDLLVDLEALATKLAFQISTTDLSRMLRLWFGNKPSHIVLPAQLTVVPEELASDGLTEETDVDRLLDAVTPPPEAPAAKRSDTTTPPPATVEPPVETKESFQQIRDRILGQRVNNDTSGPRAKAYTNPAIPLDGARTTTLPFGMSPTAITDVISRVTQAASAQGAATRQAVRLKTDPMPTEAPKKTEVMDREPEEVEINVAKPTLRFGEVPAESAAVKDIEAVERKLIETPMDAKPTESMEPSRSVHTARTRQMEIVEPISEAKPMKAAAVKLDESTPEAKPEQVEHHKEQSAKLVLPRTQSTEWFERGEQEAKEAHERHAREVEARRRPRTPSMAQQVYEEEQHKKARRKSGIVLAVLAAIAAALVVVTIVKFTGREKPSKTLPVATAGSGSAIASGTDMTAGSAGSGMLAGSAGSDMLAGSGSAMLAGSGSDMLAGSGSSAGSDVAAGSATGSGSATQVAAVIPDAAPPVDAAVIAPPIDAAQVAAVPIDAAKVVPIDAAKVAVVDAAKPVPVDAAKVAVATPDAAPKETKPKETKPKETKPKETKPKETTTKEAPASIEDLYGKGDFAKADKACATNTQFNAQILEMCLMSACQTKDTALANRWIHAIARSQREALAAKCKDAGLEIAVP